MKLRRYPWAPYALGPLQPQHKNGPTHFNPISRARIGTVLSIRTVQNEVGPAPFNGPD